MTSRIPAQPLLAHPNSPTVGAEAAAIAIYPQTVLTTEQKQIIDILASHLHAWLAILFGSLARLSQAAGMDGVVCSAQEATLLRAALDTPFMLVTPGIRPAGSDAGDQSRILTPGRAIAAGADYLVIGRPITQAPDPVTALQAINAEIAVCIGSTS